MTDETPSPLLDELASLLYPELRAIAHRHLAGQWNGARPNAPGAHGSTLETTALVHEAYLRLATGMPGTWENDAHFRAVASVVMRRILVDRARARATGKRGGNRICLSLDEEAVAVDSDPDLLLSIDAAIGQLEQLSPRLARLVELRFYGGLTDQEVAADLEVTVRTVQRDWTKARMLLERILTT